MEIKVKYKFIKREDKKMDKVENRKKIDKLLELEIFPFLYFPLRQVLQKVPIGSLDFLEEIRLRQLKPLMLVIGSQDFMVTHGGRLTSKYDDVYIVSKEDMDKTFQLICQGSVYAVEDELKNGFITLPGGHRVGITGKVILEGSTVKTIKSVSAFNIRIAREVMGAADKVLPYIIDKRFGIYNTLILSPPKAGKTTLLRDLIRQLSSGVERLHVRGFKVGLVDERSEIACCHNGVPQNNVGLRTDVLDACPKAQGIMMLLRSMSPDIIATDEIGRIEDVKAIEEAVNAGVTIITTVHGTNLEEIKKRPTIHKLINSGFFKRYIILGFSSGVGSLEMVIDGESFKTIYENKKGKVVSNAV
jgi:stage III sporulation protein AA